MKDDFAEWGFACMVLMIKDFGLRGRLETSYAFWRVESGGGGRHGDGR